MEYSRTPRVLPTTTPRADANPLPSTVLRAASASALVTFLIMLTLALFLEMAFESSVCVTSTGNSTSKAQWVRIPFDRPGEGHFLVPLNLFGTTFLDHLVMPLLFALMIIMASALLVQTLELEHFFY
jgi:hypothetical protein